MSKFNCSYLNDCKVKHCTEKYCKVKLGLSFCAHHSCDEKCPYFNEPVCYRMLNLHALNYILLLERRLAAYEDKI